MRWLPPSGVLESAYGSRSSMEVRLPHPTESMVVVASSHFKTDNDDLIEGTLAAESARSTRKRT
jgi:hypothetical protein